MSRLARSGLLLLAVLMQMMAAQSLKIEIFPGKSANLAGFDANAVMFER